MDWHGRDRSRRATNREQRHGGDWTMAKTGSLAAKSLQPDVARSAERYQIRSEASKIISERRLWVALLWKDLATLEKG